jgi:hypothetical protein
MIGLAKMAWRLAWSRKQKVVSRYAETVDIERATIERYDLNGWSRTNMFPASREYYRIIDRLSAGEQP